jgi:hypothetical protein
MHANHNLLNHALGVASRRKEGPKSSTGQHQNKQPAEPSMLTKSLESASQIPTSSRARPLSNWSLNLKPRCWHITSRRQGRFGPERDLAPITPHPKPCDRLCVFWNRAFSARCGAGVHGRLALRVPDMEESAELMAIYLSAIGSGRDGFWAPETIAAGNGPPS